MFDKLCSELDVPFKRIGSLVVAYDDEQLEHIRKLYKRGLNNNIKAMKILSQKDLEKGSRI